MNAVLKSGSELAKERIAKNLVDLVPLIAFLEDGLTSKLGVNPHSPRQ